MEKETSVTIKALRSQTKMSQSQFAAYFELSIRTLQDWEQEKRTPPKYVISMMERILKLEKRI